MSIFKHHLHNQKSNTNSVVTTQLFTVDFQIPLAYFSSVLGNFLKPTLNQFFFVFTSISSPQVCKDAWGELFSPSLNPWALTRWTFPIAACQVCVGPDKLAPLDGLLHFSLLLLYQPHATLPPTLPLAASLLHPKLPAKGNNLSRYFTTKHISHNLFFLLFIWFYGGLANTGN